MVWGKTMVARALWTSGHDILNHYGSANTESLNQRTLEAVVNSLVDFFAVRPVYTLFGLRVLWGAYLVLQILPFLAMFSNPNIANTPIAPIVVALLQACVNAAALRLLIEVAAAILLGRPRD
jgi:hypothetical protein